MAVNAAPNPDAHVAKWTGWLHRLRDQVHTLYLWRTIWRTIIKTAEGNPEVPRTIVFDFMAATYGASQAMAVRRLCGDQNRAISFRRLLREIAANPGLLPPGRVNVAEVEADLKALDSGVMKDVGRYVSQYLAHSQETPSVSIPSFEDLHAAIDALGALVRRYVLVIEDADQLLEPAVLGDWMAPFRVAWLPGYPRVPRPKPRG